MKNTALRSACVVLGLFFLFAVACSDWRARDQSRPVTVDRGPVIDGFSAELMTPTPTPDPMQEIFLAGRKPRGRRQLPTVIHAEDRFVNPRPVPESVLKFVRDLPDVDTRCKEGMPESFDGCFALVEVDLNQDDFSDFIVFGRGPMGGANVAPFWVLAGSAKGIELVLEDVALELEILEKKSGRYFQITTSAATATAALTSTYGYDTKVQKYTLTRSWKGDLK